MRRFKVIIMAVVILLSIFTLGNGYVYAAQTVSFDEDYESGQSGDDGSSRYKNSATGYESVIIDQADLLTDGEENSLLEVMNPITQYGNCVFVSTSVNSGSTEDMAESVFNGRYGNNTVNGVLFIVDMQNRYLYVYHSGNAVSSIITDGRCNTIADNVYKYASNGDYYTCATNVYDQAFTLLEGGMIAQPMKLVSNVLLSIVFGMIIAYLIVRAMSSTRMASQAEMLAAIQYSENFANYQKVFTGQTRKYDPPSSSSSGGGGGGGGGGSSGGGGHSF